LRCLEIEDEEEVEEEEAVEESSWLLLPCSLVCDVNIQVLGRHVDCFSRWPTETGRQFVSGKAFGGEREDEMKL
jgi:hypothetical protein